jgi:hypothetical protein
LELQCYGDVFNTCRKKVAAWLQDVSDQTELEKVDNPLADGLNYFRKKNFEPNIPNRFYFRRTCPCHEHCFDDKCRTLGDRFHLLAETSSCQATDIDVALLPVGYVNRC